MKYDVATLPRAMACIAIFTGLTIHLTAQRKGVEVLFQVDEREVKGPTRLTIESESQREILTINKRVPPVAPWASDNTRTVILPDWAYEADYISVKVRLKSRDLQFLDVEFFRDLGRITFKVDRAPFNEDISWLLPEASSATELYVVEMQPIVGDGAFLFYTNEATRGRDRLEGRWRHRRAKQVK